MQNCKYYFNFILIRTRSGRKLFDRPSYIWHCCFLMMSELEPVCCTAHHNWILWHGICEKEPLSGMLPSSLLFHNSVELNLQLIQSVWVIVTVHSPWQHILSHIWRFWLAKFNRVLNSRHQLSVDLPIACSLAVVWAKSSPPSCICPEYTRATITVNIQTVVAFFILGDSLGIEIIRPFFFVGWLFDWEVEEFSQRFFTG